MIDNHEIKQKEFSLAFPRIVTRLVAISEALQINSDRRDPIDNEILYGFGLCLEDVINEIKIIDKALYWPDEPTDATETCEIIRKLEENR